MKIKLIYFLCFNFLYTLGISQKNKNKNNKNEKWEPNSHFIIGIDFFGVINSTFSERKVIQGYTTKEIKKDLYAVADLGFEKNKYNKNGYSAFVSGPFIRLGTVYMLTKDPENKVNGFYGGGKIAYSFYNQNYEAIPVRGFYGSESTVSFPKSNQASFWLEASIGGRIQLFDSSFYIDMNVQPKYLLITTKQEKIEPMIIPGFGNSSGKFNIGFMWNLGYKL